MNSLSGGKGKEATEPRKGELLGAAAGVLLLSVASFLQLSLCSSGLWSLCHALGCPVHLCLRCIFHAPFCSSVRTFTALQVHLFFFCPHSSVQSNQPLLSSSTPLLRSFFVNPPAYLNLIFFPLGHLEVIAPSSEPSLHLSYGTRPFHSAILVFVEHLLYVARCWGCRGEQC